MTFAWPPFLKGHACSFSFSSSGLAFWKMRQSSLERRKHYLESSHPYTPLPASQGRATVHVAEKMCM